MSTEVEIRIPRMLAELIGGERSIDAGGSTVGEALESMFTRHPELRVHILDERGELREHVSLFAGDRSIHVLDAPLVDSGILTILQAVSGG